MCYRWIYLTFTFALAMGVAGGIGAAGAFEVTASLDRDVVAPGESVILTVTLTGGRSDSAPILPMMHDFRVSGPSYSTQIQVVNGATSISTSYEYVLEPLAKGDLSIGPIEVPHEGRSYRTKPLSLEVTSSPQSRPSRRAVAAGEGRKTSAGSPAGRGMFVELATDKKEVYLHEQVTLYFRFYYSGVNLAGSPAYEAPPTPGFVQQTLGSGKSINYAKIIDGRRYEVSELSTALFPYKTGALTIGPAGLKGEVLVQSARPRRQFGSIFDDFFSDPFFGGFSSKPFTLRSNTVEVAVRPLPEEGAPPGEVSVGEYSLDVGAKPTEVRAGDPITLTMKVKGTGDLETVAPPRIGDLKGFKTYDVTSSVKVTGRGRRIEGVKTFEQAIVPLDDAVREIPRIEFSYFDPRSRRYVTLAKGPIAVKVLPAEKGAAGIVSLPEGAAKKGVALLERNIVFIKSAPGRLRKASASSGGAGLFWGFQAVPLALIVLSILHQRHRLRLRSDIGYSRMKSAGRVTRARLKTARGSLEKGDAPEFYGDLVRALSGYIADRLNVPAAGMTPAAVDEMLRARDVPAALAGRLGALYERCDLARFAGRGEEKGEMRKAYREASEIIEALRKQGI